MFCESDGDTLLLSNTGIYEIHGGRIDPIPPIPGTQPFDTLQIVARADHRLFAAVSGRSDASGIWQFTRSWSRLAGAAMPLTAASALYLDSRDRLLVGFNEGQVGFPLEQGERLLSSGNPGLGAVQSITETSYGVMATGANGVALLRDRRLEMLNFADRIPSRGIGGLLESGDGDLWLNGMRGVVHIPAKEVQAALKDTRYAMKSELVTEGDFVGPIALISGRTMTARDARGNLWFATLSGAFHIDPQQARPRSHLPYVSIKSITMDGKPVGGTVAAGASTFDIHYVGVNLTMPESVVYKYRLDGLDETWQEAGRRSEAIYTQLRPGRYTFRVMASNGDGVWTEPVSSPAFEIAPRFYQTTWFRAASVAAALALFWTLSQLRLRQLQRRHEAQNQTRQEMTHVARLATLSTMTASITHEVSQPVSGILTNANTCARMLAADPPNIEGAAETVRRTIRDAHRATEVIKRLRAMFARKPPTIENVDLNDAAREVIALSSAELRLSGSILETDFAEPLPPVRGDRVQLQQVILNLLLNAADAMIDIEGRPRTLRVQTRMHGPDRIKLLVQDSGIGLDPRSLDKVFEAFHTTKAHGLGIGLAISRSIIESHEGKLWAAANDGPGATFAFSIPSAGGAATGREGGP
jgi:signal transduction histidine kinase